MPGTVGEVDHEANGFNPTDTLTDFDYGETSTLPNGQTLREYKIVVIMIAIGIGFHNLGEGLAIGAAHNVGEIALGTFLVVGFIIQNITEGLGIIAPSCATDPASAASLSWD